MYTSHNTNQIYVYTIYITIVNRLYVCYNNERVLTEQ